MALLPRPQVAGFLLALSLLAGACSEAKEESTTGGAANDAPAARSGSAPQRAKVAPLETSGEEAYDSASLGALHGTILFKGTPPERFPLGASESAECKHHAGVDQRQNLVVVQDGKLAGVFVRLASGHDEKSVPPVAAEAVTLDQKGCMYVPRVLGVRVGQVLRITNLDPAAHNVHSLPKRSRELNVTMGKGQEPLEFRFERAERPVPFKCDIHPWMGAAVFVEEHPWFAVSDERGAFVIRDVPPGEYVVEATHESLGKIAGSVTVRAGKSTGCTLTLGQ